MRSSGKQKYTVTFNLNDEEYTSIVPAADQNFARSRFESEQPKAEIVSIHPTNEDDDSADAPTNSYPDSGSSANPVLGSLGPAPIESKLVCGVGWAVLALGVLGGLIVGAQLDNGWIMLNVIFGSAIVSALLVGVGQGLHYFQAIYDLLRRQARVPGEGTS